MRGVYRRVLLTLLAGVAMAFLWLGCSRESSDFPEFSNTNSRISGEGAITAPSAESGSTPSVVPGDAFPAPDGGVVVVRDIEGYFEDCGCSGSLIGGLPRIVGMSPAGSNTTYIFTGRLLTPKVSVHLEEQQIAYARQSPALAEIAANLFELLPNVLWLPSEDELRQWEDWGVRDRILKTLDRWMIADGAGIVKTGPLGLSIEEDGLIVDSKVYISGPREANRAREVMVLAWWESQAHGETLTHNKPLGPMYLMAQRSEVALHRFLDIMEASEFGVYSSWKVDVTRKLGVDKSLQVEASKRIVVGEHSGLRPLRDIGDPFEPETLVRGCEGCHREAVHAWSKSKHSHAYLTLLQRSKEADVRCVGCHVEKYRNVTGVGLVVDPKHQAVTCYSCHKKKGSDVRTLCEECHTALADPDRRYLAHLKDICPGEGDAVHDLRDECAREME